MTNKKAMLIDGNSIINRAFFGLPTLTNSKGQYTNAIYGFLNIFFKLYEEEQPDYIGVAFDLKGPTFRHKKFEDYKGHRKGMPDELSSQLPVLKNLLSTMNIQMWGIEGYEADDILGTLSVIFSKENVNVTLVSGDKDLLQLATKSVKIRIPKTKAGQTIIEDYYEEDVIEIMGVTPKEYIDVKALMGDTSDNIPGVSGIGEKTAIKIIKEYGSIENAIEKYQSIKPQRISEKLNTEREQAYISKELATIVTDVPVENFSEPVTKEQIFNDTFKKELLELEFKSIVNKYFAHDLSIENNGLNNFDYSHIKTKEQLEKLLKKLKEKKDIGVSTVFFKDEYTGLSFSYYDKEKIISYFVEFSDEIKPEDILGLNEKNLIAFDSKSLLKSSSLDKASFDIILAAYVLNINSKDIASTLLGIEVSTDDDLAGKGRKKLSFADLSDQDKKVYGATPAAVALATYSVLKEEIEKNGQSDLYYNVELPLARVLANMEITGIKIDRMTLVNFDHELSQKIDELTEKIYELAGEEFNINSPVQMGNILFEKLGLKGGKKTKTGYSTAADVLEKLRTSNPIIEKILEYRTLTKLKSTYCEGLLSVSDKTTDKIHTTFNQVLTTTGRLSSVEPNLQNIPIRTELGRQLRRVFVPTDDSYIFLDADYSQIELRIMAHLSKDKNMIDAYKTGVDIHRSTAAQVLGISIEEVTDEQRNNAKAVNFGIIYGISAFSLSVDLGITKKEAEQYIEKYFAQYPAVKGYLTEAIDFAKETGYGQTILGRRRNIPELRSGNFIQKGFGERVAMNMPIQGSAADIIKIAMVRVFNQLEKQALESRLVLTVHDELLIEAKKTEKEQVKKLLQQEMEHAVELLVPLIAEVKEGESWYDAK